MRRLLGSPWPRVALGAALAGWAFFWLAREVDYRRVWGALRLADGDWLLGALLCVMATVLAKTMRWKVLLGGAGESVSLAPLLRVFLVAQALNNFLPIRVGEVTRAYLVGVDGPGRSFTMGTIVLEKALDLLCYALLFFCFSAGYPSHSG